MNYRMTELQGAVGLGQLGKLETILQRRRTSAGLLDKELTGVPGIVRPYRYDGVVHSWWIYSFTVDEKLFGVSSRDFAAAVQAEGIPFNCGYIPNPMFDYPVIQDRKTYGRSGIPWTLPQARPGIKYSDNDAPNTIWFLSHVLTMGWNEGITESDAMDIAAGVKKVATWFKENPGTKA
jgi:dTDP-4-amino-4,6-dideoxygalactose transaminase